MKPQISSTEAAAIIAARLGTTAEELIASGLERMTKSDYPTPECLYPSDVELYIAGELSERIMKHVKTCDGCKALLPPKD